MVAMRCRAAVAVSLALAFGACTKEPPPMPSTCIDSDRAGYERALAAAPGAVRLPGGVAISTCTQRVRTDAELQNLGAVLHGVAEDLAGRARRGEDAAAVRLGYLSGAVSAGAAQSNGIAAELARRIETAGVGLADVRDPDVPGGIPRSLRVGQAAGVARG
jgi:hypothetical protein